MLSARAWCLLSGVVGDDVIRVLVVDDDRDVSTMVSSALRRDGMRVVTASDGISAVEEARRLDPHVAVLDIGLPHLDGHSLGKQLRALSDGDGPRLVAMTGHGDEATARRSREKGFDAHLVKPTEPRALVRIVRTLYEEAAE